MALPSTRRSSVRFRERSELLDFLLEVATTSEILDLDRLLASVAEVVRRVIPYELFAILLYNDKEKSLRIRHAVGYREELMRNLTISLDEGITGAAARGREPVLVPDVRLDPRYIPAVDAVRTELAVPMIARQKLVGVIDVQSTRVKAYTEYEKALLRLIAARVAISIDNARLHRRIERQNKTLKTLVSLAQEFSSILKLDDLLTKISSAIRGLIPYDAFSILLIDREQKVLRHRFSIRYDQRVNLDNIPMGLGITGAAADAREPVRVADTARDPRYIASHPGIRAEAAVPLIHQGSVIGVMDLESERVGFFTDEHLRMMTLLAPQIASSIENARLYEEVAVRERRIQEDLKAARDLQFALLPTKPPEVDRLELALGLRPALQIGGDLYDFFEYANGQHMIAFGDIAGKGAAAALYGALVGGLLRTLAHRPRNPADLMKALNNTLVERRVAAKYVALLLIGWDPQTGILSMANSGALPPIVCRKGQILKFEVDGFPAGLLEDREYDEVYLRTEPGDLIVLYSDGISDHQDAGGAEYGRPRLEQLVASLCDKPACEIVSEIFAEMDRFHTAAFDDQTLLVARVA